MHCMNFMNTELTKARFRVDVEELKNGRRVGLNISIKENTFLSLDKNSLAVSTPIDNPDTLFSKITHRNSNRHITSNISTMLLSEDEIGDFRIHTAASECTQANEERPIDIDITSDGDCLFDPIATYDPFPFRNSSHSKKSQNSFYNNIVSNNTHKSVDNHVLDTNNSRSKLIDHSDSEDETENDIDEPLFTTVNILSDHPFRKPNHLVYFLSANGFRDTELIRALLERQINNLSSMSLTWINLKQHRI